MKKLCFIILSIILPSAVISAPTPPVRYSVFSTSTDWEALSTLQLNEFEIKFKRGSTIGTIGWELYYLDGFPCYGQSQYVQTWISPSRTTQIADDKFVRITCLAKPGEIKFAFRVASQEATKDKTDGIITCNVNRDLIVNLDECTQKKWAEIEY